MSVSKIPDQATILIRVGEAVCSLLKGRIPAARAVDVTAEIATFIFATAISAFMLVLPEPAAAQQCMTSFVWREAFPGDKVCVSPDARDQAAADNAAAASRLAPCKAGFVLRQAVRGDKICVTSQARDLAAEENRLNLGRTNLTCRLAAEDPSVCPSPAPCKVGFVYRQATPTDFACVPVEGRTRVRTENALRAQNAGGATCIPGYVWRTASPSDLVCVTPEVRDQTLRDNALAASRIVGGRDAARCNAYAKLAVEQAEEYFLRRCGDASDRWQTNYQGHFDFCLGPKGNIIDRETNKRRGALALCRTINPLPGGQGGRIFGSCAFSAIIRNLE